MRGAARAGAGADPAVRMMDSSQWSLAGVQLTSTVYLACQTPPDKQARLITVSHLWMAPACK